LVIRFVFLSLTSLFSAQLLAADVALKSFRATATWYEVSPTSKPAQRAAIGELTAAHNTLPFGTKVRVTSETNSLSVVVRITDRGLPRRSGIDLCKPAAEKIQLVGKGRMPVRVEVLPK
jgi:rare lipoprotein A